MRLNKATKAAFFRHAEQEYPREACGLVVRVGRAMKYWPCRNLSESHGDQFVMDPRDYNEADMAGEIVALLHSHPNGSARPSAEDMTACAASEMPWGIAAVADGQCTDFEWTYPSPDYIAPLLERRFLLGVHDCYSLCRDLYRCPAEMREAIGITNWPYPEPIVLPDFARDEFWERDEELYLENFARAGFVEIDTGEIRVGDGLILRYGRKRDHTPVAVANHAGIYVGQQKFIHHLQGRLSRRDVYGGQWMENTVRVVRYSG